MNEKKKRNTRSWKGEAKRLEGLLVEACQLLDHDQALTGDLANLPVGIWWRDYLTTDVERRQRLMASGLAKLTAAEREALGFGESDV